MTTPAPAPLQAKRRSRYTILALICVVVLGTAGYFVWSKYFAKPDELSRFQLTAVSRGDIEDVVTATGTLQPREYVDVGAQVSGQLKKIHVEVGTEVKAGDLLAEIDPVVLQSRVDATRAQWRNQRAQLMARESDLRLAQTQLRRQRNLMAEDATTTDALQTAEATQLAAQAQIEALKAQIDQTESNLRADEANLNYARIYAPMAGTVVSITARQGQTLIASQQAPVILRIADLSTMTVQTQVSEADVSRLKLGMPAYFTTLGASGRRWEGTLNKIEPTPVVQNNVVLYNALFDVANPNQALMTQMTAQVFFVVAAARDALLVPMAAFASQSPRAARMSAPGNRSAAEPARKRRDANAGEAAPRQRTVRVATAAGTLEERRVEVGVTNRVEAQVLAGLEEGERVVSGVALEAGGPAGARRPPRL
ncbi:MAG: efflux RND transporter periplasmic adaptor subunit [Aromatoleum sp.]|jgi:macrolide-specific efflux system membrane fusion protein|uniref:efflux RND transporter periplasmic adaptor subunit n=1 Tax=Aromatoleum sp. TaxID=2307007 RepID=UPI002894AE90|nr:efflux RND transporter periplasmic adaptor subunit [Aromatoleum sp.]MDT3671968.1 efflux RND transporter periplasmic adaptor subunit [Aromatoleum sp.]